MYIVPGQGTKFWCQQKGLITLPICCKFQRNLFEVWFYTILFMIWYMYIAPRIKNRCSNANNSKVINPIWPKFELVRAFMPVLITCKFDRDPIKGDWEKLEASFFCFFTAEEQVTPKWLVRYDQNSNLSEILCLSSFPVSLMKSEFIVTEKRWRHHFPHSKSMGMLKGI